VNDFIGRESQLEKMQSYFSNQGAKQPRTLILQALGGQGKSQIALEYCRRSQSTYREIFWVNGNSEITVIQSFESLAAELSEGSMSVSGDAETKIRFVKSVLDQWEERWLLVFDNYDDPVSFGNVERFLPSSEFLIHQALDVCSPLTSMTRGTWGHSLHQSSQRS
jgi:hypothetical protein